VSGIRVLIVDDNFVARRGLRSFLETEADISVAGEVSTGREAIAWMEGQAVDIVLMDVRMPDTDGITATAGVLKLKPDARVMMLTVVDETATLLRALLAGARGYLVYGKFTPEELVRAMRTVVAGGAVFVPPVAPVLLENIRSHLDEIRETAAMESMEPLTVREREIISLIAVGRGNREIAAALDIDEKTVKNHINNIYSKLQIKTRYEAISYMLRKE
jgi:DNA-binding NarL/FixJ family response regulator